MENFLEANRIVEVSSCKLSKAREMPLRKALLVSKVMNKAQAMAESAHTSFLNCGTTRCSSRLLASMQSSADVEDTAVRDIDPGHLRPWSNKPRLPSPMATAVCTRSTIREEELMDIESVISRNSVLSDILSDEVSEPEMEVSPAPLMDVTNSLNRDWSSWPEMKPALCSPLGSDSRWSSDRSPSPPLSPGKRHHSVAFPSLGRNPFSVFDFSEEEAKRFKPSPPEPTQDTLPPLYDYLSPRNLCSAPLITYMFGRGFTTPSDPQKSDWPSSSSFSTSFPSFDSVIERRDSETFAPGASSNLCPILAY